MSNSHALEINASPDAVEIDYASPQVALEIDDASSSHEFKIDDEKASPRNYVENGVSSWQMDDASPRPWRGRNKDRKIPFCIAVLALSIFLSCIIATVTTIALKKRSEEQYNHDAALSTVAPFGKSSMRKGEKNSTRDQIEPLFDNDMDNEEGDENNMVINLVSTTTMTSSEDESFVSSSMRDDELFENDFMVLSTSTLSPVRRTTAPSQYPSSRDPTSRPTPSNPLTFYAIGDVPYNDMEACLLPHELRKLSASDAKFLIHLGDLRDGRPSSACTETLYEDIATIFEASPVPTFFVIGDNEWYDCGGTLADTSMAHWSEHLLSFHERNDMDWPPFDANVTHHPDHPEMYSFFLDDVLFLGQGLPGPQLVNMPSPEEWQNYLRDNVHWTRKHFSQNSQRMKAAVIMAHSSSGPVQPYFDALKRVASLYDETPILFLEDNHWFEKETYPDYPNLYRIALDDTVTPTSITVDTDATGGEITDVFRYDRRCPCSSFHRPTRLYSYSSGECEGVCDTIYLCDGENVCGMNGATCW
eukprot:CAMPEP_0201665080 /NCGR_PEP_ID=MMETSP0494-20130426/6351_1 /ASSEMBLY_ACC=CAM_ASM_000839 /TAXON_ID=420259 /ORGANISM="Thalassiosira gravida, Strain GMp14c1" /LENGTH=530 /DNA_ID=CAMNT_0048143979 /DNA_START=319 /DNA_END=1908 /DNA_ORIENTATION=+